MGFAPVRAFVAMPRAPLPAVSDLAVIPDDERYDSRRLEQFERVLAPAEVCAILGVSESTLRRLRRSGALPAVWPRRHPRYRLSDVREYMRRQQGAQLPAGDSSSTEDAGGG